MQEQPISRLVETIVSENPLYMMMISTGIANLSALAKEVLPLIMSTTDRPVKLGTIIKALERMEAKNKVTMPNMFQLMSEAEIMVHSGIGEAEIMVGDVKPELLNELGHDAAIIISDGTRLKLIAPLKIFSRLGLSLTAEYSLIRIVLAEKAPVGFVTTLIQLMRSNKISVKHVLRYDNDVYIVVDRQDAAKLMEMLERLRSQARNNETQSKASPT
ncbi:hypothetical protein GCM10007981_00270 [Thermocladium modestius]|uniref:ACT domain-containing protein n=1 Tax=Thermocladium modestius TaxID=62609 RepID=A0A830GT66_9CREN|nr:hypothetical protein [Thermocladium modestius]GGP18873.1 hypothetical protein GCM10007981_00270 [Thermocladium modestius]